MAPDTPWLGIWLDIHTTGLMKCVCYYNNAHAVDTCRCRPFAHAGAMNRAVLFVVARPAAVRQQAVVA